MKSIPPLFAFLLFTLPLFAADPAGQVEENRRIEQEIRNLEARWTEQANAKTGTSSASSHSSRR